MAITTARLGKPQKTGNIRHPCDDERGLFEQRAVRPLPEGETNDWECP